MKIANVHKIDIPIRKILVIQLGDIGDVIWSIPAFWSLKAAYPKAGLAIMVRNNYGEFLADDPHIDRIFTVTSDGVSKSIQLLRDIRREKFDLVFDLRTDDRGAYTSFFSGVKIRAAMYSNSRSWRNKLYTHLIQHNPEMKRISGATEQSLRIIRGFGMEASTSTPQIFVAEKMKEKILHLLSEEVNQKNGWVSVNPFSRWSYKEWSIAKWRELTLFIWQKYKIPTIITGSEEERKRAEELVVGSAFPIYNFAGKTSLREMAALLQMSRLHIGVDSAAPHIAAAVGTPTVSIYGPSDWREWAPQGEKHNVVMSDMECVPCRQKGCEGKGLSKCLDTLSLAKVQSTVEKMLEKNIKPSTETK